jgi:hypothetical protein
MQAARADRNLTATGLAQTLLSVLNPAPLPALKTAIDGTSSNRWYLAA